MRLRPTRRAFALVGLCGLALWLAFEFGTRSLNAVVVPALVALFAAIVQLFRTERPEVHRTQPVAGFPGEVRTVRVAIETDDALGAHITERVGDGLDSDIEPTSRGLPTTLSYDVRLERRGEHRLGPLTLTVRDVFGLLSTTFEYPKRTPMLVYPELYDLTGASGVLGGPVEIFDEREAFDELREYVHGDSLRDVHWKSSAKRDDLLVMEFDSTSEVTGLTIAAEAAPGHADAMAAAAASVATYLLDAGLAVSLSLPETHVERAGGEPQRERVLSALARARPGRVEAPDADIRVLADAAGTRLTVEERDVPFEQLAGARREPTATAGGENA